MRILITNDDGIGEEGIAVLENALKKAGHDVVIVAPNTGMSNMSHAMTFPSLSAVKRIDERHFSVSGTPSDCVYLTHRGIAGISPDFDLVVSGINRGYNLSTDLILSGTFNAAVEGVICGYKSIAISAENCENITSTYEKAAQFLCINLILFSSAPMGDVININVPEKSDGVKWESASFGKLSHKNPKYLSDKEHAFFFSEEERKHGFRTDLTVVNNGLISVSVVRATPTIDEEAMRTLSQMA